MKLTTFRFWAVKDRLCHTMICSSFLNKSLTFSLCTPQATPMDRNKEQNGILEHAWYIDDICYDNKVNYISSDPHYRKLSTFCTDFYGNRNSLIISKTIHISIILLCRYGQTVCYELPKRTYSILSQRKLFSMYVLYFWNMEYNVLWAQAYNIYMYISQ